MNVKVANNLDAMTTTQIPALAKASENVGRAAGLLLTDIDVMSEADLATNGGGKSRCPYDLICELTGMFNRFSDQLEGNEVPPPDFNAGWPKAPEDFKSKATAVAAFRSASERFRKALESYAGDPAEERFPFIRGSMSALDLADLARGHTLYHSGQLNYLQTMLGDDEFHWFKGN